MIERNPILNDARAADRRRRLGPDAHCVICGYCQPEGLTACDKRVRRLLEQHHIFGRNHSRRGKVLLCRNHHAEVTEIYAWAGIPMRRQPTQDQSVLCALEAGEVFLEILAERIFLRDSIAPWKGISE